MTCPRGRADHSTVAITSAASALAACPASTHAIAARRSVTTRKASAQQSARRDIGASAFFEASAVSSHGGVTGEGLDAFGRTAAHARDQSSSHRRKNGAIVERSAVICLDMFEFILKYAVRNQFVVGTTWGNNASTSLFHRNHDMFSGGWRCLGCRPQITNDARSPRD